MGAVDAKRKRRIKALHLRAKGMGLRAIAGELGVSVGTVHRDLNPEKVEHYRRMRYQFYLNGHSIEQAVVNTRGEIVGQHHVADFTPGFLTEQRATVTALNGHLAASGMLSRKELDFEGAAD